MNPIDVVDTGIPILVKATGYMIDGTTATGTHTHYGTVAYMPQLYGKTVAIWTEDWDFLGYYTIEDTGGDPIRNGYVIDIWRPTLEECAQVSGIKVWILIVSAEG